jgi:hypothetical protein
MPVMSATCTNIYVACTFTKSHKSVLFVRTMYWLQQAFRHYYRSLAKSAGKDFRDGAVVPFE